MSSDLDGVFQKLFKGGGIVLMGLVVELAISFLAKAVIARFLGPVEFGAVSIGVTMLSLLSTVCVFGLGTGVGRYLPRFDDDADRRGVIISAFQIVVPVATIVGAATYLLAPTIARVAFNDPSVEPIVRIFAVGLPFAALVKLSIGTIRGVSLVVPRVVVQNLSLPVTRFAAVGVAVVAGTGAIGIGIAYVSAFVVAAAIGLYYVVRKTPLFTRENPTPTGMHGELLTFSAPLIVSAAMGVVLADLDTFMIAYFSGTEQVGIYNVIYPISGLLVTPLSAFAFLFMPVISRLDAAGDRVEIRRVYQIVTKWIFIGTLPAFFLIAFFPELTIGITFGREYVGGAAALSVLSLAFFTHTLAGPNANMLTSLGRTRIIMWDNVAIAVLNTALNLLLIPRYGFFGAAVATAVSYVGLNVLYSTQLYREAGVHPFSRGLVRPGLSAAVLVGVTYTAARAFLDVTPLILAGVLAAFTLAYGVVVLRFGGIEDEEVMLLLSFEDRFGVDLGPVKRAAQYIIE